MDQKLLVDLISIPLFTGVIGYVTNWSGVLMLFAPLRFYGLRVPGLRVLYPFLPRRVQVIPALHADGRFGWQGIVPSRAAKMASIAVDKSLAKVGGIRDFYRELEPDTIAEHLVAVALPEPFAAELRAGEPCVVTRVADGHCLLDPRCVPVADEHRLRAAVIAAHERIGDRPCT